VARAHVAANSASPGRCAQFQGARAPFFSLRALINAKISRLSVAFRALRRWRARERAGARRDARVTCREHASASSAGDDPWGGLAEPDRAWRVRRRWQSSRRRTRDGRSRTWATRAKTWAAGVFASHPHAPLGFRFWGFEKP